MGRDIGSKEGGGKELQSFQVEGPTNREISLFIGNTIGRFFAGTFQGGKKSAIAAIMYYTS